MREEVKRLLIILVIIIPFFPVFIYSQSFGTSTAEFLKIQPDAGPEAMGEAYVAAAHGTESLIFNPSGLALMDRGELAFTEILWFNNIYMHYLSTAYPLVKGSGVGLNLLYINFGSFNSTGDPNVPSITIQNMLFSAGYGQSIADSFHLGVTLKGTYENYFGNTSFGSALDAGRTPSASADGRSVGRFRTGHRFV